MHGSILAGGPAQEESNRGTAELSPESSNRDDINLAAHELIPSHRPTLDLVRDGEERTFRAPRMRIESVDFHNMLINEDVHRISFLGDGRGILSVTSRFGGDGPSTLRLWSCPDTGGVPGAFSKLNPPAILQELNFDSKLEALAVRQDGRMIAVATDGILGLYSLVGSDREASLRLRVSLAVDTQNGVPCDLSFGVGGQHLRIHSLESEPYLLSLKGL